MSWRARQAPVHFLQTADRAQTRRQGDSYRPHATLAEHERPRRQRIASTTGRTLLDAAPAGWRVGTVRLPSSAGDRATVAGPLRRTAQLNATGGAPASLRTTRIISPTSNGLVRYASALTCLGRVRSPSSPRAQKHQLDVRGIRALPQADGRGGYPMAEATQFALDANHARGPVLPRQAHDQGGQVLADRRTPRWLRLPPPRGDQPACQPNNVPGVTIRWSRSAFGSNRAPHQRVRADCVEALVKAGGRVLARHKSGGLIPPVANRRGCGLSAYEFDRIRRNPLEFLIT